MEYIPDTIFAYQARTGRWVNGLILCNSKIKSLTAIYIITSIPCCENPQKLRLVGGGGWGMRWVEGRVLSVEIVLYMFQDVKIDNIPQPPIVTFPLFIPYMLKSYLSFCGVYNIYTARRLGFCAPERPKPFFCEIACWLLFAARRCMSWRGERYIIYIYILCGGVASGSTIQNNTHKCARSHAGKARKLDGR